MDIDDLLSRARQLNSETSRMFSKTKNRANGTDIFIYQNRPVGSHDWKTEKDIVFISIYLPSHLPDLQSFPVGSSIVLHDHTVFQTCDRIRYCHVFGWDVDESHYLGFHKVWGYLYSRKLVSLGTIDLELS